MAAQLPPPKPCPVCKLAMVFEPDDPLLGYDVFVSSARISAASVYAPKPVLRTTPMRPSHGENRGSSPLGSANKINDLV